MQRAGQARRSRLTSHTCTPNWGSAAGGLFRTHACSLSRNIIGCSRPTSDRLLLRQSFAVIFDSREAPAPLAPWARCIPPRGGGGSNTQREVKELALSTGGCVVRVLFSQAVVSRRQRIYQPGAERQRRSYCGSFTTWTPWSRSVGAWSPQVISSRWAAARAATSARGARHFGVR